MTLIDYLVEQGSELYALFPDNFEDLVFMSVVIEKIIMMFCIAFVVISIALSVIFNALNKFR